MEQVLAAGIGEGTVAVATKVINNPWTIPIIRGFVEGTIKSMLSPDSELSSSVFNDPVSIISMNATEYFWNLWTISKGGNPLPNLNQ